MHWNHCEAPGPAEHLKILSPTERASRLDLEILKDFTITMQSISMVNCPVGSCLSAMFGLKYFVFNSLDGENNYHWS